MSTFVKQCVTRDCVFNLCFQTTSLKMGCARFDHHRESWMPTMFLHSRNSVSPAIAFSICVFRPPPPKLDAPKFDHLREFESGMPTYIKVFPFVKPCVARDYVCKRRFPTTSAKVGCPKFSLKVGCPLCFSICETVCRSRLHF